MAPQSLQVFGSMQDAAVQVCSQEHPDINRQRKNRTIMSFILFLIRINLSVFQMQLLYDSFDQLSTKLYSC